MNVIVAYDIVDNRRRTKFHKFLKELGIRSQKSVFECRLDERELNSLRRYCRERLDFGEDRVRMYRICPRCMRKAVVQGRGIFLPQLDWVVL